MILPSRYLLSMSHISLLAVVSSPEEGSSRKISFDPPMRAIPSWSFHFIPPESPPTLEFHLWYIFRSHNTYLISVFLLLNGVPLKSYIMLKCSQGVNNGKRILCWGHIPMIFLNLLVLLNTSTPITSACPLLFESIPLKQFIVVVFPAPLWPKSAKI